MLQVYDLFLCICPFPKSFQCLVPQFLPDQKEKRNVHFALRTRTVRHFITAYISTSEYLFHFLWPGFFIALSLLCSLVLLSLMSFILPAIIQLEILITVEISLKTWHREAVQLWGRWNIFWLVKKVPGNPSASSRVEDKMQLPFINKSTFKSIKAQYLFLMSWDLAKLNSFENCCP